MVRERVGQIAESQVLKLGARVIMWAMPFVLAALVYFAQGWIELKFQAVTGPIGELKTRVDVLDNARQNNTLMINDLRQQVAVIQSSQMADRKQLDIWRGETNNKLDRINDNLTSLASAVAGLNATLEEMQRR